MKKIITFFVSAVLVAACAKVPESDIEIAQSQIKDKNQDQNFQQEDPQEISGENSSKIYTSRIECPKPKTEGRNMIIAKTDEEYGINYFLEWDCNKRAQRWTAYQMHQGNSVSTVSRSGDDAWHEDETIPADFRSTYEDYRYSGFDRGHLCPSADRLQNKNMNRQTFCYSNMQPQYNSLNAAIWADMESKIRSWNVNNFRDTLYVVKGGTIDNKDQIFDFLTHDTEGLIIPKYFFMAVLCVKNGKYKALGFWIEHKKSYSENEKKSIKQYAVSIDQLETFTGIDFFYNLEKNIQDEVEKETIISEWGF
ncbi:MAG: DNA/RNA non-specific endonuclease [Bacteroidales bacterium]|nr:DNA/RNA non-specific endonuclease [Bacteroidales bacterium]